MDYWIKTTFNSLAREAEAGDEFVLPAHGDEQELQHPERRVFVGAPIDCASDSHTGGRALLVLEHCPAVQDQ